MGEWIGLPGDEGARAYLPTRVEAPTGADARDTAFSKFAAYPVEGHETIKSSPAFVRVMNSVDCDPPIAPESASTGTKSKPQREKILQ